MFQIENVDGVWTLSGGDQTIVCQSYEHAVRLMGTMSGYQALAAAATTVTVVTVDADDDDVAEPVVAELDGDPDDDGEMAADEVAEVVPAGPALRAERWRSGPMGAAQAGPTGPRRDFTGCEFSWRALPLPLMVKMTASHGGMDDGPAMLAGFVTEASIRDDGGVDLAGTFLDNAAAAAAVQVMEGGGRFWCSLDPSEYVDAEFECTEEEDGWCIDGVTRFVRYELAGLTLLPFQGFEACYVVLDNGDAMTAAALTAATPADPSAPVGPLKAPRAWFEMAEPTIGADPDGLLVRQPARYDGDERWAVPLTITDDGRVFGHLAAAGTCHIGYADQCVTVPPSPSGYARYMLHSYETAEGDLIAVGPLVASCDHALARYRAPEARDYYAHNGLAWADVRIVDGIHGPWICGALRHDVTVAQVQLIRTGALSGDWRDHGGALDLIAAQLVSTPGFPIVREQLAASAAEDAPIVPGEARLAFTTRGGQVTSLVAAGVVVRDDPAQEALVAAAGCATCAEHAVRRRTRPDGTDISPLLAVLREQGQALAEMAAAIRAIDIRTRHFAPDAADAIVAAAEAALAR